MTSPGWDPAQYLEYADHRLRPFLELVGRVNVESPHRVVDLGCGPGNATALLLQRWPDAVVTGIDSSEEMIEQAKAREVPGHLSFELGDARKFAADHSIDVLVSNAALHWMPGHLSLFATFVRSLSPGGWFAFQVPGSQEQPSHALLIELARQKRWNSRLESVIGAASIETPERYLGTLAALGCEVDAWETTYYQVLLGENAVLEWMKGTTLRPFLTELDERESAEFLDSYGALLREAYPEGPLGTVFPFRRIFVVAHAAG